MAKLGVKSIRGNVSPLIGQATFYEVHEFYPGTPIADHDKVKWNLYAIENGKPRLLDGGPTKFGRRVSYEFPQKWYGESLMIEAYVHNAEGKAPPGLIVRPVKGPKKVATLTIKDGNENTISTAPKYGEHITAIVTTDNMVGDEIDLAIWERDTISSTGHDAESNALLWNKKCTVSNKNGVVKQKILLDTGMMAKANKSFYEGSEHEYYLVVKSGNMQTRGTQTVAVSNSEIVLSPSQRTNPPRPVPRPTQPQEEEKSNIETITAPIIVAAKVGWDMIMDKLFKPVTVNPTQVQGCEGKFCIKKGDPKSELIREINIRLAGFGGNVPTDEFTDRTEKMIKQFQRDYMKVPETGKVCGNVLKAIDDFSVKFDISTTFWEQLKCSCNTKNKTATSALRGISEMNKCTGFGDHTGKSTYKQGKENIEAYHRYEYPGIHRSLLFGLKALQFYFSKQTVYTIDHITSGYRCRFKNYESTNHQGKAIDIQFSKGTHQIRSERRSNLPILRDIRDDFYIKHLGAQKNWPDPNLFSIEPIDLLYYPSGAVRYDHTFSWIHFDIRQFESKYREDKYFCKDATVLNGKNIILLAKEAGYQNTCSCLKSSPTKIDRPITGPAITCEDKFKKVAPIILKHEGGYKNEPSKDKGDPTNKGISWPIWVKYAKEDLGVEPTASNQKDLTDEQATKIYRKRYWEPKGFCKIVDNKVSLMIYDWTITSGGATREVQKLLVNEFDQILTIDGGMGPKTAEAVNNVSDQNKLLNRIAEIRREYYKKGAEKGWFSTDYSKGLDNRVTNCLNYEI